jgi:hypothetical protein
MAKHYLSLEKGTMFEMRFNCGRFKGAVRARGGIDNFDTR